MTDNRQENRQMKTQAQMFYDAQNEVARKTEAFLMLCHPERYGANGAEPLTLDIFNKMVARYPARYEIFRAYAEKNLKAV